MTLLLAARPPRAPKAPVDGAAARRALRAQVAHLQRELTELQCSAWPRTDIRAGVADRGGARLLALGGLEQLRDRLAAEVAALRRELDERGAEEEQGRRLIEEMLLDPAAHQWVHVSNQVIGEPGCKHWHVRPRWSLLGRLMGWWRVVVSSGCPLAGAADAA